MVDPYDELIAQIDEKLSQFPDAVEQEKLRLVFSPVEKALERLRDRGKASEFAKFLIPRGIGCSCKLPTNKFIVAHCLGPVDETEGSAKIEIGKGDTPKMIIERGHIKAYARAPDSHVMIKKRYGKIFDFIVKAVCEEIPS